MPLNPVSSYGYHRKIGRHDFFFNTHILIFYNILSLLPLSTQLLLVNIFLFKQILLNLIFTPASFQYILGYLLWSIYFYQSEKCLKFITVKSILLSLEEIKLLLQTSFPAFFVLRFYYYYLRGKKRKRILMKL